MSAHIHPGPDRGRPTVPDMGDNDMHELPIDPRTGIRAIALLPSGRVVWPIGGGDGTDGNAGAAGGDAGAAGDAKGQAGSGKETELQAEIDKWKALARQHEGLWKSTGLSKDDLPEAKALLAKAKEIETSSKTAEDRVAALEAKIAEAEARSVRLEVAAAKGLSPAMAKRLIGATREELEADADALTAEVKPADGGNGAENGSGGDGKASGGTPGGGGRPRENLRSGAAPDAKPEENDPAKLAALIPRG